MLIPKCELINVADKSAVAIYREDVVVGHIPFNLAISNYLRRDTNKIGETVNRGAGYELEIPCIYSLHRPKQKIKELVESLT